MKNLTTHILQYFVFTVLELGLVSANQFPILACPWK